MGHEHDHAAGRAEDRGRLRLVLLVSVTVVVVELVGAWVSHSLALVADAGHLATDATSVVLALSASYVATLAPSPRRTWGYHRAEVLAALVNAVVLLGVCGVLVWLGLRRLVHPGHVDAGSMVLFAGIGLAANVAGLALLAGRRTSSLTMRAVYLEVASDALGSFAALVAGVLVATTGFARADPIASLLIALLVLPRSAVLLGQTVAVLLEATPPDLDVEEVRTHLCAMDGVVEVHDLHAWLITSGMPALSAHVTVTDAALASRGVGAILDELCACARSDFGIEHATFQVEPDGHRGHEDLGQQEHP
ncbi:MAG: cation diffusion facilitator family transporter [Marmoricola sp.]